MGQTIYNGMPALPADRRDAYDFYDVEFTHDGYPGKKSVDGPVDHPMYGSYVIADYARQFQETGQSRYVDALERVSQATLRRMQPVGNALVFYYDPALALSSFPGRYYSGLTQANYLVAYTKAYLATRDERYYELGRRVLNSLLIPSESGGVYKRLRRGASIEEYPAPLTLHTLNGWVTTLRNIIYFRRVAERRADTVLDELNRVLEENLAALVELLPSFDVEEIFNTRYQLGAFNRIRLVTGPRDSVVFENATLSVPSESDYPIRSSSDTRWENGFTRGVAEGPNGLQAVGRVVVMNLVMTRCPWSTPHKLTLGLRSPAPLKLALEIADGDFDPMVSALPNRRWLRLGTLEVREGRSSIEFEFEPSKIRYLGYPTNFRKVIAGQHVNVYHKIHVVALYYLWQFCRETLKFSGNVEPLEHFLVKWRSYMDAWAEVEPYRSRSLGIEGKPFYRIPEVDGPLEQAGLRRGAGSKFGVTF